MDPQTFQTRLDQMFANNLPASEIKKFINDSGYRADEENINLIDQYEARRLRGPTSQRSEVIQQPGYDTTGAAVTGAVNGLTAGFLPQLGSVVDTFGGTYGRENVFNSNRGVMDLLRLNSAANERVLSGLEEDHPYAYNGGQAAGTVAGIVLPVAAAARGARATTGALAAIEEAPSVASLGRYAAPSLEAEGIAAATGRSPSFHAGMADDLARWQVEKGNPLMRGPAFNAEQAAMMRNQVTAGRNSKMNGPSFNGQQASHLEQFNEPVQQGFRQFARTRQRVPYKQAGHGQNRAMSDLSHQEFDDMIYRTLNGLD